MFLHKALTAHVSPWHKINIRTPHPLVWVAGSPYLIEQFVKILRCAGQSIGHHLHSKIPFGMWSQSQMNLCQEHCLYSCIKHKRCSWLESCINAVVWELPLQRDSYSPLHIYHELGERFNGCCQLANWQLLDIHVAADVTASSLSIYSLLPKFLAMQREMDKSGFKGKKPCILDNAGFHNK